MKVSVLIPITGESPFLMETLKSVLRNGTSKEIILVDDGVIEQVKNMILEFSRDFKSEKILIIPNAGQGLADALNTGVSACCGEFIARLDSDDLMNPSRLSDQLQEFLDNPFLLVLGSQCEYIDAYGNNVGESRYPSGLISNQDLLDKGNLLAHPSVMFRRDAFRIVGSYREWFKWYGSDLTQDYDFWLRASQVGQVRNSRKSLTKYRQHEKQVSQVNSIPSILGRYYVAACNSELILDGKTLNFGQDYWATFRLARAFRRAYGLSPSILSFNLTLLLILARRRKLKAIDYLLRKFIGRTATYLEKSLSNHKFSKHIYSKIR